MRFFVNIETGLLHEDTRLRPIRLRPVAGVEVADVEWTCTHNRTKIKIMTRIILIVFFFIATVFFLI